MIESFWSFLLQKTDEEEIKQHITEAETRVEIGEE